MRSAHTHGPIVVVLTVALAALFAACGASDKSAFSDGTDPSGDPKAGDFGSSGGGKDGEIPAADIASLAFDPPSRSLTVEDSRPQTAQFRLRATLKNGSTVDVSAKSLQFERPDLASLANGIPVVLTATGTFGGKGKLHAIYGNKEAVAELDIKVVKKEVAVGIAQNIVDALDAANLPNDPSLTKLRYPYDKTVFPLGITSPLVMWDAPGLNDVYRIHYEQANYTYDRYVSLLVSPAQFRIDQTMWDRITASNTGDPLKVTVSRYARFGNKAYRSASVSWTIAPVSLRGAIYYWSARILNNVDSGKIVKLPVGAGAQPQIMSTGIAGQTCMGCHAVSADGSTLVASVDAAPTGDPATYAYTNSWMRGRAWASFDLPSGNVRKQTNMVGNNLALTPDGKYTVFGGRMQTDAQANATPEEWARGSKYLTLADTKTGDIIPNNGLDDLVLSPGKFGLAMPAFSPDGKKLATVEFSYSTNKEIRDNIIPTSNAVLIFGFDQGTLKFSPAPTRLPQTNFTHPKEGLGYPSFTPDSKSVAYHVGNASTGCTPPCDDTIQHFGDLYLQNVEGPGQPVRLAALDDPPVASDRDLSVEPTFNPVQRGGYSWVVFTSMRDWGNKLTGTPNNGKRRLWVAAIDANTNVPDPSHPAFYLDGQREEPNMRGFWTLSQCTATPAPGSGGGKCTAGFECCSGLCDKGVCVDVNQISCQGLGGSCSVATDCCNPNVVACVAGKCEARLAN